MPLLRIPTVLAFTVLGATAAGSVGSCGTDKPTADAASCVVCVYETVDNGNCPFPTCATGSHQDVCPAGCIIQPLG
ncbi:MAG TPA: hypothetical protein VK601_07910 [Kofleriaceae bacterium]|nr:hypothetical protein [Kofleriaceae bacterium]